MEKRKIHFGTIGIKIDDEIKFKYSDKVFLVSSGDGTPDNGGTMVRYKDGSDFGLFQLLYLTRRLMGNDFNYDLDIFKLWTFKGKTLRSLHNVRMKEKR